MSGITTLGILGGPGGIIGFGVPQVDATPVDQHLVPPHVRLTLGLDDHPIADAKLPPRGLAIKHDTLPRADFLVVPTVITPPFMDPPDFFPDDPPRPPVIIVPAVPPVPPVPPANPPLPAVAGDPGATCGAAAVLNIRTSVTVDIIKGTSHWWSFTALLGITYHVRVSVRGFISSVNVASGTCAALTTDFNLLEFPGCNTLLKTEETTIYILITGAVFNDGNYTIELDTGSCP